MVITVRIFTLYIIIILWLVYIVGPRSIARVTLFIMYFCIRTFLYIEWEWEGSFKPSRIIFQFQSQVGIRASCLTLLLLSLCCRRWPLKKFFFCSQQSCSFSLIVSIDHYCYFSSLSVIAIGRRRCSPSQFRSTTSGFGSSSDNQPCRCWGLDIIWALPLAPPSRARYRLQWS